MANAGSAIIIQGTQEWRMQRKGNFTSSQIFRLMTDPKSKEDREAGKLSEGAKIYVKEIIAQEIAPLPEEHENDATRWGHENEGIARYHYQRTTGIIIQTSGFISSSINGYGGSPDGITREENSAIFGELDRAVRNYEAGCIEIKCPFSTAIHIGYCLIEKDEDIPKEYYWQCVSNIYLTNSQWCDFISFDPRIDHNCGLFIHRINRKQSEIDRMIDKINKALEYKEEIKRRLKI